MTYDMILQRDDSQRAYGTGYDTGMMLIVSVTLENLTRAKTRAK